jgi:plastocyanin
MRLTRLALVVAGIAALACSDDATGPTGGHSTTITVRNNSFNPSPDTVAAGQVTFTWAEGTHNVTWDSGPTTPANIDNRSSGSVAVTVAAGTYAYHCSLHLNMNGVIVVQ